MTEHRHEYSLATDVCEINGCDRIRPDWLDDDAITASRTVTRSPVETSDPGAVTGFKMTPVKYVALMLALLFVTNLGARAWSANISEENVPSINDIPVTVTVD